MIVHIVLMKQRNDLSADELTELTAAIASLQHIRGVQYFSYGSDISARSKGYTHAAVITFADRDALQAYGVDDEHLRVVQILNRLAPDRLIVDYETEAGAP